MATKIYGLNTIIEENENGNSNTENGYESKYYGNGVNLTPIASKKWK